MSITRVINGENVEIKLSETEIRKIMEKAGYFGLVWWSDDDIVGALRESGCKATKNNVEIVKERVNDYICDVMIEHGWDVINNAIDYDWDDLEKDEEG